jgi:hypothetical protein
VVGATETPTPISTTYRRVVVPVGRIWKYAEFAVLIPEIEAAAPYRSDMVLRHQGRQAHAELVNESVSPFATVLGELSAPVNSTFPALEASHTEMWLMVSEAVIEYDPSDDSVNAPPDAAVHVAWLRVVTADTFAVADAPGSPVWSLT